MSSGYELRFSFIVILFLTLAYLLYEVLASPSGGHPFGHALGIIGAILMLMTEFLYSARKRWHIFQTGRIRSWLSFHIFTGIVGPFLVLMHTGLEFRGIAGLSMLFTIIVVLSGFIGRYIYTSVPRTLAGVELDRRDLERDLAAQRKALSTWSGEKPSRVQALVTEYSREESLEHELSSRELLLRQYSDWRANRRLHKSIQALEKEERSRLGELERMINQQQRLIRQINSLRTARRLMGSWHTFHIPLGITLFASMFIHIAAVFYYGGI